MGVERTCSHAEREKIVELIDSAVSSGKREVYYYSSSPLESSSLCEWLVELGFRVEFGADVEDSCGKRIYAMRVEWNL